MAKNGFSMSNRVATEELEAAKTLTVDDCGKVFTLAAASGFTVTLPSPQDAGDGWNCKFIVATAITSNSYIISGSSATDALGGGAAVISSDGASADEALFFIPSSDTALNLNGSTKGGKAGDVIDVVAVASQWQVTAVLHGSGTLANPWS